jgi:nucleotide-binding universal stress UspA family protein
MRGPEANPNHKNIDTNGFFSRLRQGIAICDLLCQSIWGATDTASCDRAADVRNAGRTLGHARIFETEMAAAEKKLDRLLGSTRPAGVRAVRSSIRAGAPSNQIVEVANDLDADLIVIATHGFTSWKYFTIGSTAEQVARSAPCPVLVVREKERDFVC